MRTARPSLGRGGESDDDMSATARHTLLALGMRLAESPTGATVLASDVESVGRTLHRLRAGLGEDFARLLSTSTAAGSFASMPLKKTRVVDAIRNAVIFGCDIEKRVAVDAIVDVLYGHFNDDGRRFDWPDVGRTDVGNFLTPVDALGVNVSAPISTWLEPRNVGHPTVNTTVADALEPTVKEFRLTRPSVMLPPFVVQRLTLFYVAAGLSKAPFANDKLFRERLPPLDELIDAHRLATLPDWLLPHATSLAEKLRTLVVNNEDEHEQPDDDDDDDDENDNSKVAPLAGTRFVFDDTGAVSLRPADGRTTWNVTLEITRDGPHLHSHGPVPGDDDGRTATRLILAMSLHRLFDPSSTTTVALHRMVGRSPFERIITSLNQVAAASEKAAPRVNDDERLVFSIGLGSEVVSLSPAKNYEIEIVVKRQRRRRDGVWSPARPVKPETLLKDRKRVAAHAEVLAIIAHRRPHEALSKDALISIFTHMSGLSSSHVVLHDGKSPPAHATLRFDVPEIKVTEQNQEVRFCASVGERTLPLSKLAASPDGLVFVERRPQQRPEIVVVTMTPPLLDTAAALAPHEERPLVIPEGQHQTFVEALHRLSTSDVALSLPPQLEGNHRAPPNVVTVVLERTKDGGIGGVVGHRAVTGTPVFAPDRGPDRVFGLDDGDRVFVERDRAQELAGVGTVLDALGVDPFEQEGQGVFQLSRLDRALDVTERLHRLVATGSVVAEWVGTQQYSSGGSVDRTNLRLRLGPAGERWLTLEGDAFVDDALVPLHALVIAAREHRRYVVLDDERFFKIEDALLDDLTRLAALAQERTRTEGDGTAAISLGLEAAPTLSHLIETGVVVEDSPSKDMLRARMAALTDVDTRVSDDFRGALRPYQEDALTFLLRLAAWGVGGCLADDMGLGKTIVALAVLDKRRELGPALVVAPLSVAPGWQSEAARFAPHLNIHLFHGDGRDAVLTDLGPNDVVITSYGILTRDDTLLTQSFATAVFDEAQALKNHNTIRSRQAKALNAAFTFALTGTPVENNLAELWSIFHVVSPGVFGSAAHFQKTWRIPIERDREPRNRRALRRLIRPFLLRRRKADVLEDLPAKTEIDVVIDPFSDERALYEAARQTAAASLAKASSNRGGPARMDVLAWITRLRRLACHATLFDAASTAPSAKLERVLDLACDAILNDHRILIFSQFLGHLDLVEEGLRVRNVKTLRLDGETPLPARTAAIDAFQGGHAPVFLISVKAGGTGLNLTAADFVFHLDPWWNPAVEDQATDRAHRLGQEKPVTVYRFVTRGTIEEKILRLHADKRELIDAVLSGADGGTTLSVDELMFLLR